MTDQFPVTRSNSPFKQAVLGGYDREEVDDYVERLERRIEELERQRSPDGAVQRALEQVGDEVSGILQRAHETAAQLTTSAREEADRLLESARAEAEESVTSARREAEQTLDSARRESDERLGASHRDAASITAQARERLRELDVDTDRVWAERERLLGDIRILAQQLLEVSQAAVERFPSEEEATELFDVADEPEGLGLGTVVRAPFEDPAPAAQEEEPEPVTEGPEDPQLAGD